MDFNKYSSKIRETKKKLEEITVKLNQYKEMRENQSGILGFVHGMWKRLSQTAESGNDTFSTVIDPTNGNLFKHWSVDDFVEELRAFSFDVTAFKAPKKTQKFKGIELNYPRTDGEYVLVFRLKGEEEPKEVKEEEKKSWADICCEKK